MRVFLAVEIPENIKKKLAKVQEELRPLIPGVRWEKVEKLHITLVFLGEVADERIKDLERALQKGVESAKLFGVGLSGVRVFPNEKRPRVVLVEIGEGRGEVEKLQKRLAEALTGAGFEFARLSRPHVTLGRFKKDVTGVMGMKGIKGVKDIGEFRVEEIAIVESKLHPAGAIHTPIARVPL